VSGYSPSSLAETNREAKKKEAAPGANYLPERLAKKEENPLGPHPVSIEPMPTTICGSRRLIVIAVSIHGHPSAAVS
jgi:hypothetical protein